MQMPKKTGLQVVSEIREMISCAERTGRQIKPPKFVFLTAYVSQWLRKHATEIGISYVYEKPLGDSQIYDILCAAQEK